MDILMNLNTGTYTIAIDNTNKTATLIPQDINTTSVVLYNASTNPVFVVSGVTAPTAVFPTSATAPLAGKVIAPGTTTTFTKDAKHGFISAIQLASGTGNLYISVGAGE
jgi:hypothetical protein